MEERNLNVLAMERQYLPEIIDDTFIELYETFDYLPVIKWRFEYYLMKKNIYIEYDKDLITFTKTHDFNILEKLIDFKIESCNATVSLEIERDINLNQIVKRFKNVEYNPKRFPGVVMHIVNPRATIIIFSTGKMVMTGIRQASEIDKIADKVINMMKKLGVTPLSKPIIESKNILASCDLYMNIDLEKAALVLDNTIYDPTIFSGLTYKMKDPNATFLIFSTGKIICTGNKEIKILEKAVLSLYEKFIELNLGEIQYFRKKKRDDHYEDEYEDDD